MPDAALLLAWGTLVGLDLVTVGQVMITRPLVAGTVTGMLLGDPTGGFVVGVLLELFALDVLPVGAVHYPDYGVGAVAGVAAVAGTANMLGVGLAVALALAVAYLGELGILLVRRRNTADVRRHLTRLDAGERRAIRGLLLRGVSRDAVRAVLTTGVGLGLAYVVRHWPPVTLQGAMFLAIAMVGGALGTAVTAAIRLGRRGGRLKWLGLGLACGAVWVVVT